MASHVDRGADRRATCVPGRTLGAIRALPQAQVAPGRSGFCRLRGAMGHFRLGVLLGGGLLSDFSCLVSMAAPGWIRPAIGMLALAFWRANFLAARWQAVWFVLFGGLVFRREPPSTEKRKKFLSGSWPEHLFLPQRNHGETDERPDTLNDRGFFHFKLLKAADLSPKKVM